MGAPRTVPSDAMLRRYVEDFGWTHQQIADHVSKETGMPVARSTISAALSRAGLTNRVRYSEYIPWSPIKAIHNHHYALVMLRVYARLQAGVKVPDDQVARYEAWRKKLEEHNAVVAYIPDSDEGFYYVPRKPSDGDALVTKRKPRSKSS